MTPNIYFQSEADFEIILMNSSWLYIFIHACECDTNARAHGAALLVQYGSGVLRSASASRRRFQLGLWVGESREADGEDDVVICAGYVLKAGVRVGVRSVVGMGSVVTRDVPPDMGVFGNPARVRYSREEFILKKTNWENEA